VAEEDGHYVAQYAGFTTPLSPFAYEISATSTNSPTSYSIVDLVSDFKSTMLHEVGEFVDAADISEADGEGGGG